MKRYLGAVVCALVLLGCAVSHNDLARYQRTGSIKVEASPDPSYDYRFTFYNTFDPGVFDGGNTDDRLKAVNMILSDRCQKIAIIEENMYDAGSYGLRKKEVYHIKVTCNR